MTNSHDYAAQRADTYAAFGDLTGDQDLPDSADLDFFLIPADKTADWRALADALTLAEYVCEWVDASEDGGPYLVATLPDQPVSAQSIWIAEELATQMALSHGFTPDGWGLSG